MTSARNVRTQWSRGSRILKKHGLKCSMVTTETFHHAVFAASPAAESPQIREYAADRLRNTVRIGHELEAQFAVYWPGSLGYYVQGAVEETETLKWYADGLNAACEEDIKVAKQKGRSTLKHCMEAKPFEPQAEILLPTSDAMLAFIASGAAHTSGDGWPQPRISARADVGRCAPSGTRARPRGKEALALRHQRRLSVEARCRHRGRAWSIRSTG